MFHNKLIRTVFLDWLTEAKIAEIRTSNLALLRIILFWGLNRTVWTTFLIELVRRRSLILFFPILESLCLMFCLHSSNRFWALLISTSTDEIKISSLAIIEEFVVLLEVLPLQILYTSVLVQSHHNFRRPLACCLYHHVIVRGIDS